MPLTGGIEAHPKVKQLGFALVWLFSWRRASVSSLFSSSAGVPPAIQGGRVFYETLAHGGVRPPGDAAIG
jgi:hypothetical protein